MPRKILLSFLGTNNYLPCNYYLEGKSDQKVENVKYIQEALVQLYRKDFASQDQVLLFLTEKAERMNFWDDGHLDHKTKLFNLSNTGLNSKLKLLQSEGFQFQINHKRIKEGFSQEEVWSIFETVADEIQEGDQIIFDITHAFRFLPMLGIVLLNYLKVTKNITVLGVHYGAFEKLGSFQEVSSLAIQDRNAPIIDLKTLLEFQSWTSAVNSFIKFGETKELSEASQPQIKSIMVESSGADLATKNLRYIIDQLVVMTSNLQTNRLNILLNQDFTIFTEKLINLRESDISVKPFKQILKLIEKKVTPIIASKELIWLESAKWCLEHKLVQQAFTQLQEGLLTYIIKEFRNEWVSNEGFKELLKKYKIEPTFSEHSFNDRKLYSSLLNIIYKKSQNDIGKNTEYYLVVMAEYFMGSKFESLSVVYAHITEPRNDINHAGIRNDPMKSESLHKRIGELISQVETLLT